MIFNKKLIYKIIDNKINKLELHYLTKQELNTLYNALNLNHFLKEVDLSNIKIDDITLLCKILKNNSCLRGLYLYSKQIKNLISFKFL